MGKKLILSIGLSLVVHKEIIDGHIFTQKLFVKPGNSNVETGNCYRCGNVLSATLLR